MAISNIGYMSAFSSNLMQKQQSLNKMVSAIKSGNLNTAQNCYISAGLPPMAPSNTSPLGRLYNALLNDDLAGAQKAAIDMKFKGITKVTAKPTPIIAPSVTTKPKTLPKVLPITSNTKTTPAQSKALATLIAKGGGLYSTYPLTQKSSLFSLLGNKIDTSA